MSLLLTIAFALPGYVYHRSALRQNPERTDTAVGEILSVLFASIAIDVVVLLLLVAAGAILPVRTINASRFVGDPPGYLASHLELVSVWSAIGLALGLVVAVVAGARLLDRLLPARWREWRSGRERYQEQQSAWWRLFHENPDSRVYVGCSLDNGSYVAGYLNTYSKVGAEHADRELSLRPPITYRASDDSEDEQLDSVGAIAISARHIVLMTVTYTTSAQSTGAGGATATVPPSRAGTAS